MASGCSKPTADILELAPAKGSRSQSMSIVASGICRKTKNQRPSAISEKSGRVSFSCEHICGNGKNPNELVADTGRVQKSPDCLAVKLRNQPSYQMKSAMLSSCSSLNNICAAKWTSIAIRIYGTREKR